MYSEKLEELISLVLSDGILTEQKRDIIKRRAEKEGEDVDEVMMIVEARLQKQTPQFTETELSREETHSEPVEPGYNLIVPENAVPKVLKIIDGYNKKAKKWGYELLTYNVEDSTISGKFTEKTDAEDSKAGFMAEMKEAYKNGYLEEEWKKILKLCNRMDLCK